MGRVRDGKRCRDLGIEHDSTEDAGVLHSNPEIVQGPLVVLVGAMGEIESSNVHASFEKLLEHGNGSRSRSQSANDLGLGDTPLFIILVLL